MIPKIVIFILIAFSSHAESDSIVKDTGRFNRKIELTPSSQISPNNELYLKWRSEINPFAKYAFSSIKDHAYQYNGEQIYKATYTTEDLGLRVVPEVKKNLPKHLIISGDSNTFGVGCNDNETLPYYLSKKFTNHTLINFGLGGAGPNSTLRFMELFEVQKYAPENFQHGAFILDFHYFVIQRIVGTKSFVNWADTTPQYTLNSEGIPVYRGPFSKSWITLFYKILNLIPYNETLFPDLPRIGDAHFELTAKIILEIKKKYLAQTSPDNKFIVVFNPEFKYSAPEISNKSITTITAKQLIKKLKKYNIEFVRFKPEEVLDLTHFEIDGHFTPEGHKAYAEMLYEKLKNKI